MLNMGYEIIDILNELDDKELIKDCLFFLYHTTKDVRFQSLIEDWFDNNYYCIDCGEKLESKEYEEHHTELDGNPTEYCIEWYCPNCD